MSVRHAGECEKAAVYELLRTGTPASTSFYTVSHVYGEKSKLTRGIIGYDANSLYLYCLGDVMPCGKDTLVVNKKPFDLKRIAKFSKDVLKEKVFGFAQVAIEVPDEHYDKFREMPPLFVVQEILIVMILKLVTFAPNLPVNVSWNSMVF